MIEKKRIYPIPFKTGNTKKLNYKNLKLFIVPTPIGNLEDITLRAIRILKEVDVILAEDTRTSGNLMKHLGIAKRLYAHHQHNEHIGA